MAGVANPNYPQQFYDTTEVTAREAEVQDTSPDVDFAGGVNRGASNACGIGINTGDYDPKADDWDRVQDFGGDTVPYTGKSQYIGIDPGANEVIQVIDPNAGPGDRNVGFFLAAGDIAPDGVVGQISANDYLNRTGTTVPTGAHVWAVKDLA